MPGVTIQFHMLFDELTAFVAEVMDQQSLAVELERFYPKEVQRVTPAEDLAQEIDRFGHVDRIGLLYKPPRCRKDERFNLHVGRLKGDCLEQSHFGAATEKAEGFKILQGVARQLKKRTQAGIWVVGEAGHIGFNKQFRFSPGAAEAERRREIRLTAIGFTQSFHVDPPQGSREEGDPKRVRRTPP
jgi:hypothetical protein